MSHPADEAKRDVLLHGWLPALISAAVLLLSVVADVALPGKHWFQRAGSVVTVLGAYVAYRDAKQSFKYIGGSMYMNFELPYRKIAVVLVVVGTVVWGYGDFLL
jgi:hypothetical protein